MAGRVKKTIGKHQAPAKVSWLHIIVGAWVLVLLCIVAGVWLAPKKPPAPPPSSIAYEKRPERSASDFGDESPRFTDPAGPVPSEAAAPAANEAPPRFRIFGTVTDAKTGQPLPRARAMYQRVWREEERETNIPSEALADESRLANVRGSILADQEADQEGRYVLPAALEGEYTVMAYATGYISAALVTVEVSEETPEVRLDFSLSKGASISGRVTETGSNAGAAGIHLHAEGLSHTRGVTGKDGAYTLSGLGPGEYTVTLDLRQSPYQASGGVPSRNVAITGADQEVKGVNFVVNPAGTVWGYVLGPDKKPFPRAVVLLCTSESIVTQALQAAVKQAPPIGGNTDNEGYYELVGVPLNKEWRVYADVKNSAPQLSEPFLLTPKERSVHIDIFVLLGSDVTGRVISTDGSPIPHAEVTCLPGFTKLLSPLDSPAAFRTTRSRGDGAFEINDLPIGEYQILAMKEGFKFATTGEPIYPDGMNPIRNVIIQLTPVGAGEHTVFGTVADTNGAPIADVRLTLASVGGDSMAADVQETKSNNEGEFVFTGVDAGFFILTAEKQGYTPKTVEKVRFDEATNVVMAAGALVSGTVLVRETGTPPPSYGVRALPALEPSSGILTMLQTLDGAGMRSFNNPDGSYQLALPAGTYRIQAYAAGFTPGGETLELQEGEHREDVTLYVSRSGGRIQGRVVLADGKNPSGAVVTLGPDAANFGDIAAMMQGTMQKAIQVDESGAFTFENLAAGTYNVLAQLAGYAQGQSGPVAVAAGQTVSEVVVRLGSGGSLQGYVSIDGQLKPGVVVTVVGNAFTQMATTDRNGQYAIEGIPAGSYLASAVVLESAQLLGQFSALHAQVEIADGQRTTYNFGEEAGAILYGTCTPPPPTGTVGIALLRVPGSEGALGNLNLASPSTWFQAGVSAGNFVIGMARIGSDGYFTIENVPQGTFVLDVLYLSMSQLLSSGGKPAVSAVVTVGNQTEIAVDITVPAL